MLGLLFASCQREDKIYSCDPNVDNYIKENLSEVQKMTRAEFIRCDEYIQKEIFNALPADKKVSIWRDKFVESLELDWCDKEKKHIELLIQTSENNTMWYEDPLHFEDEIDLFSYKWMDYAENELGWDKESIYNMIIDPGTVIRGCNKKIEIVEYLNNKSMSSRIKTRSESEPPPTTKCSCNTSYDDCGTTGLMKCFKWNCVAIRGCGFLGTQVCDGGCYRTDL